MKQRRCLSLPDLETQYDISHPDSTPKREMDFWDLYTTLIKAL